MIKSTEPTSWVRCAAAHCHRFAVAGRALCAACAEKAAAALAVHEASQEALQASQRRGTADLEVWRSS